MRDHVYKKIDLIGTSKESMEDAVRNALAKASTSVRNMRWFEVTETRGNITESGGIDHWQVGIRVGFTIDD